MEFLENVDITRMNIEIHCKKHRRLEQLCKHTINTKTWKRRSGIIVLKK